MCEVVSHSIFHILDTKLKKKEKEKQTSDGDSKFYETNLADYIGLFDILSMCLCIICAISLGAFFLSTFVIVSRNIANEEKYG